MIQGEPVETGKYFSMHDENSLADLSRGWQEKIQLKETQKITIKEPKAPCGLGYLFLFFLHLIGNLTKKKRQKSA